MEEEISREDYKDYYNYLKESVKSYKNFNGLLTGFSLTSLIFLFSTSVSSITAENFINLIAIIPWILYTFVFFLINTILYYFIEISCYKINYNSKYNYSEKYNKLVKRENIITISHLIFMFGLIFLLISLISITTYFAGKAVQIFIYNSLFILNFIILFILLFVIVVEVFNLFKLRRKKKNR